MPMPPPKPTTEGQRDRRILHELGQIMRALKAEGPLGSGELAMLVGARFWEAHRYDHALAFAVSDGLIVRDVDGRLHTT